MANYEYKGRATHTFQKLPGFKNIVAWQAASDLTTLVSQLVSTFGPGHYRLANQMRGAAISVSGNVAEGYASGSLPNYLRYCNHARGSLAELGSYVQDCEREGLVKSDALDRLLRQYSVSTYLLDRLIQALIKKELTATWDNKHQIKETAASYGTETLQDAERTIESTEAMTLNDLALYANIGTTEDLGDFTDATAS